MKLYPEQRCNQSNFFACKFCFKILDLFHSLSTSVYGLTMLRGTFSFTSVSSESHFLVSYNISPPPAHRDVVGAFRAKNKCVDRNGP